MNAGSAFRSTVFITASICNSLGSGQISLYHTCFQIYHSPRSCLQRTQGLWARSLAYLPCRHLDVHWKCHNRASVYGSNFAKFSASSVQQDGKALKDQNGPEVQNGGATKEDYPSGDLPFRPIGRWDKLKMRLKMLFTVPWQRITKGSVLKLKLSGKITDQFQGPFTTCMSLPQVCQNLVKAAYDPRVAAVYLQVEPLDCGWGKIEEVRRHILFYKKTGKLIVGFMPVGGEKEYYLARLCDELYVPPGAYLTLCGLKVQAAFLGGVLEKLGVEPEVQRIGKYKTAGDLISRKDMSEENREMLTALLDDIYHNWIQQISTLNGKEKEDVENLLNEGVFQIERLKEAGWITDIKYDDEVEKLLKKRLNVKEDKKLPFVDNKKYSRVNPWTLNLSGSKEHIAILRAVGSISRTRGRIYIGGEGVVSEQFIEQIRQVRDGKKFKAAVLRVDSPGGDALASDLMWRELRLLAEKKPLIASMVDVAASGGYYMAMAADTIVAEELTLTGSIGVVTGRFSLKELYERIGYNKEVISRGKFAELDAEQRPLKPEEKDFFAKLAQEAYKRFRDKAAFSRSMEVTLMEFSRRPPSVQDILRSGVEVISSLTKLLSSEGRHELLQELTQNRAVLNNLSRHGVQARMENVVVEGVNGDWRTFQVISSILQSYFTEKGQ